MEIIKKKIRQITTTGTTTGTTGNSYVIIPDTGVTYTLNLLLTQNNKDWGFFDAIGDSGITGIITCGQLSGVTSGSSECDTGYTFTSGATISADTYVVTGFSKSRLAELRKFSVTGTLDKLYKTSNSPASDGVDTGSTITGVTYLYYIGGITYIDDVTGKTTTFSFISSGYSSPNFVNLPYVKLESKQNIVDKPEVDNNVFIIREEQQILDKNYRLRNIRNITELTYYAGGAFYNIVNNT
jgi:hypothetical protein